jgi:hypothetical protein
MKNFQKIEKRQNSKKEEESEVLAKSAKGLSMMILVKFITKVMQIFLNFAVIRKVEPKVYGLTVYHNSIFSFQTFLVNSVFREVYQKRQGSLNPKIIKKTARNLVKAKS